jgi:tripartite-type tricarboxylate transporter receptor subunit TctC
MMRASPGKLNASTTTRGSYPNLAAAVMKQMANLDFAIIPFDGDVAAAAAAASGTSDFVIGTAVVAEPMVKSGLLVRLATVSAQRDANFPDIPTVAESGIPGYAIPGWVGLMAPKDTPPEIVDLLQAKLAIVLQDKETSDTLKSFDLDPLITTPAAFAKQLDDERHLWESTIQRLGLSLD